MLTLDGRLARQLSSYKCETIGLRSVCPLPLVVVVVVVVVVIIVPSSSNAILDQVERLCSENPPAHTWLAVGVEVSGASSAG